MLTTSPALGGGGGGKLSMVATWEERERTRLHTGRAVFSTQTFCPHVGGLEVLKVRERAHWLKLLQIAGECGLCGCGERPAWVWARAVPVRGCWRVVIPPGWASRYIMLPCFSSSLELEKHGKCCVFLQMLSA